MKLHSGDYRVCGAAVGSFYELPVPPVKEEHSLFSRGIFITLFMKSFLLSFLGSHFKIVYCIL